MAMQDVTHVLRLPGTQIQPRCSIKTILKRGKGSPPPRDFFGSFTEHDSSGYAPSVDSS